MAVTHFVTQFTHASKHFRALNKTKKFCKVNCYRNVVSKIHKNYLFCPYNPPKIRNAFMFVSFQLFLIFALLSKRSFVETYFFFTNLRPHFQNNLPYSFFCSAIYTLHSKPCVNGVTKCVTAQFYPLEVQIL